MLENTIDVRTYFHRNAASTSKPPCTATQDSSNANSTSSQPQSDSTRTGSRKPTTPATKTTNTRQESENRGIQGQIRISENMPSRSTENRAMEVETEYVKPCKSRKKPTKQPVSQKNTPSLQIFWGV